MKKNIEYFDKNLKFLKEKDLYPAIYQIEGSSAYPEVFIKGEKFTNFVPIII